MQKLLPRFFYGQKAWEKLVGCAEPETLRNFHQGIAQSLRLLSIQLWGRAEPETFMHFHERGAQSVRLLAFLIWGCENLRRSALRMSGVQTA